MKREAYNRIRLALDRLHLTVARRKAMLTRDKAQVKKYQDLTAESLTPAQRDALNAFLYGKPTGGATEALLRREKIEDDEEE